MDIDESIMGPINGSGGSFKLSSLYSCRLLAGQGIALRGGGSCFIAAFRFPMPDTSLGTYLGKVSTSIHTSTSEVGTIIHTTFSSLRWT